MEQLTNVQLIKFKINSKGRRSALFQRDYQLYLLIILPIAYFILFKYVPMYGAAIAFQDYSIFKGVTGSEWIGFENFRELFAMSQFYTVVVIH